MRRQRNALDALAAIACRARRDEVRRLVPTTESSGQDVIDFEHRFGRTTPAIGAAITVSLEDGDPQTTTDSTH